MMTLVHIHLTCKLEMEPISSSSRVVFRVIEPCEMYLVAEDGDSFISRTAVQVEARDDMV